MRAGRGAKTTHTRREAQHLHGTLKMVLDTGLKPQESSNVYQTPEQLTPPPTHTAPLHPSFPIHPPFPISFPLNYTSPLTSSPPTRYLPISTYTLSYSHCNHTSLSLPFHKPPILPSFPFTPFNNLSPHPYFSSSLHNYFPRPPPPSPLSYQRATKQPITSHTNLSTCP